MARFLFAWELGGGMGHVVPLAQVAAPLLARGHEVHFALRDLSLARLALGPLLSSPQVRLWPAPVWMLPLQGQPKPATYAELLLHAGYGDASRLHGLAAGWRNLLDAITPDVLLADHAPTALLAARGRVRPRRALIGSGFFQPPARAPLPVFRDWEPVDPRRVAHAEAAVLATCNTLLAQQAAAPLRALHELLAVDLNLLTTWPEIDHYGATRPKASARYVGALSPPAGGALAAWGDADGPRVLAYLKGEYPALQTVLQTLAAQGCNVLAYVSGLPQPQRERLAGPRLRLSAAPLDLHGALQQADAVACHGGTGTVLQALAAARPVLVLPMQAEQMVVARRVIAAGAGAAAMVADIDAHLAPALRRVLDDAPMRQRAQALAAEYARLGDAALSAAAALEALMDGA